MIKLKDDIAQWYTQSNRNDILILVNYMCGNIFINMKIKSFYCMYKKEEKKTQKNNNYIWLKKNMANII
jgi:hypothetical protein